MNELSAGSYAAKLCADLDAYGDQDWYLPAAGALNAMYQQLGPVGSNNITFGYYWSSSEFGSLNAWYQSFYNGAQGAAYRKDLNHSVPRTFGRCRCVRR